ncbi:XAC2610-related protein [Zunongwangia endophytica]|uniref:XAC2610-related protein n=1 Tax=Zunongwangia endophytica TaxID=1808945 RepID=UPI0025B48E6C|nr:hypothetical protein [Zunongwangia endophytica]MDN3594319.1 hypothetical protein [Zunongwangia endophytica]
MKIQLLLLMILTSISGNSQSSYSGNLGKYNITLIMYHYKDGDSRAYYVYDKFDTPITINGRLEDGELKLLEKDYSEKKSAILIFKDFKESDKTIKGKWISIDGSKTYPISLKKDFEIDYGNNVEWKTRELIQSNTTEEHYFKTIITKEKGQLYGRISGVKIFEKKSDKLIQTIELDCQLFGIDNVSVGDYNFDGIEDFSVFEASYAGPNTSSIYILRDPNSNQYIKSNFSGTSLEFDNESKLIYEHNQCCAGRSHRNATYKVDDNEMVLIEEECLDYDEKQKDFIEVECE